MPLPFPLYKMFSSLLEKKNPRSFWIYRKSAYGKRNWIDLECVVTAGQARYLAIC